MVPHNDNTSEDMLLQQARVDRARTERMEAEVEKLQAEIRKLSAERELQALKAGKPHRDWGPWGWMAAIGAAALLGALVAQMPAIVRALGATC